MDYGRRLVMMAPFRWTMVKIGYDGAIQMDYGRRLVIMAPFR